MADLVGQAAEDDDAFWGHEIWQEDADASDAESYSTEEEKPDVFDSDFNDTEDDGDDDDDEGSGSDREASNKRANRYKDPSQTKKRPAPTHSVATGGETDGGVEKPPKIAKPRQPRMPFDESEIGPRTLRQSTKSKTIEADLARIKKASEVRVKPRVERIKPQFTQEEMLQEALRTEEENARWLAARKYQQKEKDAADRLRMKTSIAGHKDFIRYHSSKDASSSAPKALRHNGLTSKIQRSTNRTSICEQGSIRGA
eukprot:gene2108-2302_t